MRKLAVLGLTALLLCTPLAAQRGRGNQGNPRSIDNTVYLSGQVLLEDGSPPPDLVAIERICRGQTFPEGFTDQDGTFAVRLGTSALGAMEDAGSYGTDSRGRASGDPLRIGGITGDTEQFSTMKNKGMVDLIGCDLRARLDGYRSNAIILGRRSTLDDPDVGIIVLRPIAGVKGLSVSATSMAAPPTARKLYDRARKELGKANGKPDKAEKDLIKALDSYPEYAAAWALLGDGRVRAGNEPGALEAYEKARSSDPDFLAPYPPLVKLNMRSGRWEDTAETAARYLQLNPAASEERFYLALAQQQLGELDEALATLEVLFEDERAGQAFPQARHVRGTILAERGQFAAAAKEWTLFLEAVPSSAPSDEVRRKIEEWKLLGVIE